MTRSRQIRGHEIPAHVPAERFHPIDLPAGPTYLADPYGLMANLHRTHPPVFYSTNEFAPSTWVVTKFHDCLYVLRHPELFTNKGNTQFPRDPDDWFDLIPVEIEPPEHRKYRAILDPIFSPTGILKLEADIRAAANELIDRFIDKGECEFTTAFSRPLPVSVFLDIMGLPFDMCDSFVRWVTDTLHSYDPAVILQATNDIDAYLKLAIAQKQAKPDSSALSAIVHARPGGQPLSLADMRGFAFFVFIAGIDTVYATLNNIFWWLARNPDRRHEIITSPENIVQTVEELLRVFTVTFSGRTATRDLEVAGVAIKGGDRVFCCLPSANFDPDVFPNPREIDFHRPRKPILAFSGGVHSCMGSHLARLEIRICLEEFLRRIPDFELKEGAQLKYLPGGVIGPNCLPLVW